MSLGRRRPGRVIPAPWKEQLQASYGLYTAARPKVGAMPSTSGLSRTISQQAVRMETCAVNHIVVLCIEVHSYHTPSSQPYNAV